MLNPEYSKRDRACFLSPKAHNPPREKIMTENASPETGKDFNLE